MQQQVNMWIYINTEVANELGLNKAFLLEHIFMRTHHRLDSAFLNISGIARELPISLSTIQRLMKELLEEGYVKRGASRSTYSLTPKFYNSFNEYQRYDRPTRNF
jgi:DNA-binding IclR family transcriptional regulator